MEKALYLKTISQLKDHLGLSGYDRLYIGSEFCVNFIPEPRDLELCFSLCEKYSLSLSLVLPFCSDKGLKRIEEVLKIIFSQKPDTEIIINDLGQLWLLKEKFINLKRAWGRLLAKTKSDDRLINNKKEPYKLISADQELLSAFFKKHKIERLELNNIGQGIKREKDIALLACSLYIPYVYTAVSRNCFSRPLNQPYTQNCPLACGDFYAKVSKNKIISGNAIFYENSLLPPGMKELKIDRIVTEKLAFEEIR